MSFPSFHSALAGVAALFCTSALVRAGPPIVTGVDVRGLQIGKTTALTITGAELLPNPRLLTTARIAKQTLKDGAKPDRITLEIELAEGSQPGLENWWLVTDNGVSARSTFATDHLPQKPVGDKPETLPVALHGTLAGSQVREVSFSGKAGQEILCEVEAQRLESKLRPALKLYGPGNAMLKWSLPLLALRGDTRLEVKLPADGEYRLQLHDLQFAAAAPGHFRLKIGQWSGADLAFPSTVQRGTSAEVQLVGPGGEARTVRLPSNTEGRAVPAPWADPATASGPQAAVWLSDLPELLEERAGSAPQSLPALPVAVNGRISSAGEEDAYELTAQAGMEVEMEVSADTLGSPIDAELELRDLKGARLAINDDAPGGPDPRLTYKVPENATKFLAVVRDVNGNGGPRCIYRFQAIVKAAEKSGGFTLGMIQDSHTLQPGRASVFKVEAVRDGYEGPIELAFDHLPEGVKVSGQTIPAQATGTLLTLSSDKPTQPVITALKGRAKDREALARFDSALLGRFQPWLENDLALAGAAKSQIEFSASWGPGTDGRKVPLSGKLILPVQCSRPLGHDGPVRLTLLTSQARPLNKGAIDAARALREEKAVLIEDDKKAQQAFDAVAVAKTALTKAQDALAAANKAADATNKAAEAATKQAADAAAKAAADAPAEPPADKANADDAAAKAAAAAATTAAAAAKKAAADAATALDVARKAATTAAAASEVATKNVEAAKAGLAGAEKAAADAAMKAKNDVEFALVIPAELPEVPHQIAFKAELLKRDRNTVEAVAYTPVRDFPVINPLVVKVTPPAPVKLDAKTGATLELTGQIERLEGAKGEVALTLAGLPPGVTAPATATVKDGETQFKFALKFPANFKPGDFPNLKVSGTSKPYGTIQVKSRDAVVAVKVLPFDPPPEPKPAG